MKKIKIDNKSLPVKKKSIRTSYVADEKYTGVEPVWDTDRANNMDDAEFEHYLRKSFYYYNYHFSVRDLRKFVYEWMVETEKYSKDDVRVIEKVTDSNIPMTLCSLIMANRAGMPLRDKAIKFIDSTLEKFLLQAKNVRQPIEDTKKKTTETVKAPTIQDRLNEKTSEYLGELEGYYDDLIVHKTSNFRLYDFLKDKNVAQSQLGKFENLIRKHQSEIIAAQEGKEQQLKEAYKHYKQADFKRHLNAFKTWLDDIAQYNNVKKTTKKARLKKSVSKDKVVAKLQYLKEHKPLKLVSINPIEIIGAKELWIFNTKTRKLGKYVAEDTADLSVKGTTIVNFDTMKSITKTLRKPDEKLKEFFKAGKIQLRKFIQDIKATETKLTGRINADVILLKVQS